jgi:hypothetical protein
MSGEAAGGGGYQVFLGPVWHQRPSCLRRLGVAVDWRSSSGGLGRRCWGRAPVVARRRGRAPAAAGVEQRWGWSRGGGEEAGVTEMDEGMEAAGGGLAAAHRRRRGSAPVASFWMAAHRTNPRNRESVVGEREPSAILSRARGPGVPICFEKWQTWVISQNGWGKAGRTRSGSRESTSWAAAARACIFGCASVESGRVVSLFG